MDYRKSKRGGDLQTKVKKMAEAITEKMGAVKVQEAPKVSHSTLKKKRRQERKKAEKEQLLHPAGELAQKVDEVEQAPGEQPMETDDTPPTKPANNVEPAYQQAPTPVLPYSVEPIGRQEAVSIMQNAERALKWRPGQGV